MGGRGEGIMEAANVRFTSAIKFLCAVAFGGAVAMETHLFHSKPLSPVGFNGAVLSCRLHQQLKT